MPRKLTVAGIVVLMTFVVTLLVAYAHPFKDSLLAGSAAGSLSQADRANDVEIKNIKNLARQPEALKVSTVIGGKRFKSRTPSTLIVQGVLKTNSDTQPVTITRQQAEDGERVEVAFGGRRASLAWARDTGPLSLGGAALSQDERILLERLTCDSADYFVLAQLYGASYSLVIRNLRPDDAGDEYTGPIWDVVRVDDVEPDEQKRPLSSWRLYYINRNTGLIDKVVSEVLGERVEAQLADWTERNDEKFPSSITWSRGGQTLMTFNFTNVSSVSQ
jgi:hypothetical protein